MLELIIFLITFGILLVVVEWYLPSGAAGAVGVMALVAAVVLSYYEYGAAVGTIVLGGVVVGSVIGTILWLKYFPIIGPGKKMVLEAASGGEPRALTEFMGKEGEAISVLRPSGMAKIDGQRVDVVSESGQIEAGERVRVVTVEGRRVVVRKIG